MDTNTRAEYQAKWREENLEKVAEYDARYREKNPRARKRVLSISKLADEILNKDRG